MLKIIKHIFLALIALFSGCKKQVMTTFPMIKKPGIYELHPTGHKLSVELKNRLVVVTVLDSTGRMLVENDDASSLHRWVLYWEKQRGVLWFYSGDVGTTVWDFSGRGKPLERVITPHGADDLISIMPEKFFAELSRTSREQYRSIREQDR